MKSSSYLQIKKIWEVHHRINKIIQKIKKILKQRKKLEKIRKKIVKNELLSKNIF